MIKIKVTILFLISSIYCASQESLSVYFDTNKYDLKPSEKEKIDTWLSNNKNSKVLAINGYTDEDGTSVSNDTLSKKRVFTVFNYIKNKIKVREDFKTRSFGENFLQSKNKAENRRATLYFITEKDLDREDEILGIKKNDPPKKIEKIIKFPEEITVKNPNGIIDNFSLDTLFMKKINEAKKGEILIIENLQFVINTFIVENKSRGKLYELLLVMQSNPKLKIELQGHLCCNPKDVQDLSTKRAKAVHQFLVMNGIDSSRLSFKGFGSTRPIYPLPEKNERESQANRRVEIVILEN